MNNGKYAFIVTEDSPSSLQSKLKYKSYWWRRHVKPHSSKFQETVQKIFGSVIVFAPQRKFSNKARYDNFTEKVRNRMSEPPFNSNEYKTSSRYAAVSLND